MISYLRTLLLFYRRHLRVQPLRELMAILGVAAGVALLFAVQVAHHSITGSFEQIASGVAGKASLEVAARGPEGFDQNIAEAVQRMPGVAASAPILTASVLAAGPAGQRALTLVGATEQIRQMHGRVSSAFERAGEASGDGFLLLTQPIARQIGVRPGDRVSMSIDGRAEAMKLAGTVGEAEIGGAANSPIAAAPLPIVQVAAGMPGRVSRVLIEPRPGARQALSRALARRFGGTLEVRPIDTEAQLLGAAAGSESQVTLLFSVISLVAGMILAYNALLLASEERRRFIAYLIETGTPDSMVLCSLAFDALLLGVAGCAIGLIAGEAVSLVAYRSVPGYIAAAFPIAPRHVVAAQTVEIAIAGGMLAALMAALLPAVAALRSSAIAQPEAIGRTLSLTRRLYVSSLGSFVGGGALICVSVLLALISPGSTVWALVGLAAGIVICLPLIARGLTRLARGLSQRLSDPAARLSVAELRGAPSRTVALLATGTIAAFLMIVIGGSVADVQGAVRTGAAELLSGASLWVKPGGPQNVYTTEPFAPQQAQRRIERLRVVASVQPWRDSFLDLPGRRVWVLGVPAAQRPLLAPSQLLQGSLELADARIAQGGWAAVSQTIARAEHLRIGDRFSLPTPAGIATLRLAAITANYGWLSGAIVMSAQEHARLWPGSQATELAVRLKHGVDAAASRQLVQQALPAGSSLSVQSAAERRTEVSAVLGSTLSRLNDTTIVVLVTTIASVLALMMSAVWQSRTRLDSLISIGMGYGQLGRMIFYESGTVLLIGCAIGLAAGLSGQYLIDGWLQHTTGSPVHFSPAWQLGLRTAAVAVGISLAASLGAALRASRLESGAAFSSQARSI